MGGGAATAPDAVRLGQKGLVPVVPVPSPSCSLQPLLVPVPDDLRVVHQVGPAVNSARDEGPELAERVLKDVDAPPAPRGACFEVSLGPPVQALVLVAVHPPAKAGRGAAGSTRSWGASASSRTWNNGFGRRPTPLCRHWQGNSRDGHSYRSFRRKGRRHRGPSAGCVPELATYHERALEEHRAAP